jgi:hypothetical protein
MVDRAHSCVAIPGLGSDGENLREIRVPDLDCASSSTARASAFVARVDRESAPVDRAYAPDAMRPARVDAGNPL